MAGHICVRLGKPFIGFLGSQGLLQYTHEKLGPKLAPNGRGEGAEKHLHRPLMYSQATCCDSTACSTFLDPLEGVRRQLLLQPFGIHMPHLPHLKMNLSSSASGSVCLRRKPCMVRALCGLAHMYKARAAISLLWYEWDWFYLLPWAKKLLVKIVPFCLCLFWQWRCLWKGSFFFLSFSAPR